MTVSVKAPTSTTGSIQLNGSDVLTIDSSGNLTVPNNLTSTGGIYLGGTASANLLDDYEKGTWTPTSVSGFTLGNIYNATYIKIGKLVYVSGKIQVTCSAASGVIEIGGLPFTRAYDQGLTGIGNVNFLDEGGSITLGKAALKHNLTTNTRTICPSFIYEVL